MSFIDVSLVLFETGEFWGQLGCNHSTSGEAFGQLNRLLSLSRSLRSEQLERPPPPSPSDCGGGGGVAVVGQKKKKTTTTTTTTTKRKRRGGGSVASAEALLFKQPESLLHRAVHRMFAYDADRRWATSMQPTVAARRFALPLGEVRRLLKEAMADDQHEGHTVAKTHWRVTIPMMLRIAIERKGGLNRIGALAVLRTKAKARSLAKLVLVVEEAVTATFVPLLRKVRPATKDRVPYKRYSRKRLIDNYAMLKAEVRGMRAKCEAYRTTTTTTTTTTTNSNTAADDRGSLVRLLSSAKRWAVRLEQAHMRLRAAMLVSV